MRGLLTLGERLKKALLKVMSEQYDGLWLDDFLEVYDRGGDTLLDAIDSNQFFHSKELCIPISELSFYQSLNQKYMPTLK